VPAIDPNVLQCVFYLYPTLESAQAGREIGGTGFFVGVQLEVNKPWQQIYAVTNRHCILKSGLEVVLRINKADGTLDYLSTRANDWKSHPDLHDVAVLAIELNHEHEYNFVGSDLFFITPERLHQRNICPGDDVFMVGRLIGQDGKQNNLPTVRFGNISRMTGEPIEDEHGIGQDSFLVEMRSFSGYSGSPVFLYINPTLARPPHFMTPVNHPYNQPQHGPWLLGIDWCHIPNFKPVLEENRKTAIKPNRWVEVNSGIAGVVPAWHIQAVFELPELVMQRKETDKRISEMNLAQTTTVSDY